jgi:site-specific recombinase XerC
MQSAPTVKRHLAAIRMLFDWLATGGILPFNPASAVRGPKHVVKRGKTPVLDAREARQMLDGIYIRGFSPSGCTRNELLPDLFASSGTATGPQIRQYDVVHDGGLGGILPL